MSHYIRASFIFPPIYILHEGVSIYHSDSNSNPQFGQQKTLFVYFIEVIPFLQWGHLKRRILIPIKTKYQIIIAYNNTVSNQNQ